MVLSYHWELSFEERVGIMIDMEWARRKSNKLLRLIKKAEFRYPQANVEDIEYHPDRKLDKAQILRLSDCIYVQEKRNLIIMGAAGNGKSCYRLCLWYSCLSQILHSQIHSAPRPSR